MNIDVDITNVVLKTNRLVLRAFKEDDLDDFFEYASVDGVGEMAGWRHHENKEESLKILKMFIEEKKVFAVTLNNKVIGSIGIENYNEKLLPELDSYKARELGFVLSKDYWGQGIIPEACNEVINYCFNTLNLDVLVCGHYSFNKQSNRAQEKMGFKHYLKERSHFSEIWQKEDKGWYSLLFKDKSKTLFNFVENRVCQSCGMPITSEEELGSNDDGSINYDYCKYCYINGEFIDKVSMEEYIEMCSKYGAQANMSNDEMKAHCTKLFPTLKRWKKNEKG